jgi:hypothetical protein
VALEEQIATKAKEIRADGYPMSIGEVLSLYRDSDLQIHPEFQRIFRWDDDQKSGLIESILLGIPIPPVFVSQRADGVWYVIDGVQRLSTVLQFVGIYRDEAGDLAEPLTLSGTEYWSAPQFLDTSGAGISPRQRFPRLVLRSRDYFGR